MANFRAPHQISPSEPATGSTYLITPADVKMALVCRSLYVGSSGNLEVTMLNDAVNYAVPAANVDATANTITMCGHSFLSNDRVMVNSSGTLPSGLAAQTAYYVIFVNANTIQLSATFGGSAVALGSQGTGNHAIFKTALIANAAVGYHPLACKAVNAATTAGSITGLY